MNHKLSELGVCLRCTIMILVETNLLLWLRPSRLCRECNQLLPKPVLTSTRQTIMSDQKIRGVLWVRTPPFMDQEPGNLITLIVLWVCVYSCEYVEVWNENGVPTPIKILNFFFFFTKGPDPRPILPLNNKLPYLKVNPFYSLKTSIYRHYQRVVIFTWISVTWQWVFNNFTS